MYEKIQEALTVAGQTAADIAEAESRSFQNIATEAAKVRNLLSIIMDMKKKLLIYIIMIEFILF